MSLLERRPTVGVVSRVLASRPSLQGTSTTLVAVATGVLAIAASLTIDSFATTSNLRGLCLAVSLSGIVAVGLSLVTIGGQLFSLSIPALVALSTISFATTLHFGLWAALALTVALGTGVGVVQGLVVGRFDADPIITTIAAAAIMVGLGQLWTNGRTIIGHGDAELFNSNVFGFLPFQTLVFMLLTALLYWLYRFTVTGRKLTLLGLNGRAATMSGIRKAPLITMAFGISGLTTGIAGTMLAAQTNNGQLLLGSSLGFDAIVAVIVGGVAIGGGVGTPLGAAIGAVFVGLLANVASLIGLDYQWQLVAEGVLILSVVLTTGALAGRRQRR